VKKRTTRLIAACALAGLVCALTWLSRSKEPRYMGKTLVEWIEEAQPTSSTNSAGQRVQYLSLHNQKELQGALRMLGSNAVPTLIAILDHSESVIADAKLKTLRSPRAPQSLKAKFAADLNTTHQELGFVSEALRFLGKDLLPAIPDLERILCEPGRTMSPRYAASALAELGITAAPVLERCRTNAPADRLYFIESSINRLYQKELSSSDPNARTTSVFALVNTRKPPFEIVFPLVELLDSPHLETRRRALNGLSRHLPTLAPSLIVTYHAIERQTTSDDPEMRRVATELLAKLNPPPPGMKP
jgi:hypothetical protein